MYARQVQEWDEKGTSKNLNKRGEREKSTKLAYLDSYIIGSPCSIILGYSIRVQ